MISATAFSNSTTYTPVTPLHVIGNASYVDGSYQRTLRCENTTKNSSFEIQVATAAAGAIFIGSTTASELRFGTSDATQMILTTGGFLGIGTTTPSAALHVASSSTVNVTSITTNVYRYNASSNAWSNVGTGPQSFSVSAIFASNIQIGSSLYTTSDRRLKENIKPIEITLDHYSKLNPVSYNYKNHSESKIGFIAQQVIGIVGEAVSLSENDSLHVEDDGDIEGFQYSIDYQQISVVNCSVIKQLIEKVQKLEEERAEDRKLLNTLLSRPVVSRWLKKASKQEKNS